MSFLHKISSYTTIRNPVEMDYPFVEAISSVIPFSDEVCILNSSDKEDGTEELLKELQNKFPNKIKIKKVLLDWKAPNHGIFDGQTKQMARAMCNGSHLFQFDSDEIVHENHADLIPKTIEAVGTNWSTNPILNLPVVEYWGNSGSVRIDVNLWKSRISLNVPNIVHGIPKELRQLDEKSGLLYAKHGTDTCDYINRVTGERIPTAHFIPEQVERLRMMACKEMRYVDPLQKWFNATLYSLPGVFHYSWWDIERKIQHYKLFWTDFWKSMYNESRDEKQNPFFPGTPWSEVTLEMIENKARELQTGTSGWVFHQPWDGSKNNGIKVDMHHPKIIQNWLKAHENHNK